MVKDEYKSPLVDELELDVERVGTDVLIHHDEKNERLLVDIPIGVRRKFSQSGTTMGIANAKYVVNNVKGDMTLNLNVWDKAFLKEEMPKLKDFMQLKKNKAEIQQQINDLK